MAKISEYPAPAAVIPTAQLPLYDPTDPTHPDKAISETQVANVPSVVKGFADQVTITIGAVIANVRAVTVQVKNADAVNLARTAHLRLTVYNSAAATALGTGGTTGIAIGANGMIIATITAKLVFDVKTDATGLWTGTYTDTGSAAAYLGVRLPDGRETISAVMTTP